MMKVTRNAQHFLLQWNRIYVKPRKLQKIFQTFYHLNL